MGLWNWLTGYESEYEECDNRLVLRHEESGTTWTYGGNYDQQEEHEGFFEHHGYEVVEDNRGFWRKLFG